ncbi:MAG TPA: hypothetical protein ENH01_05620 [Nitrospirae bacterium]|nr:hypothetical protein [Nitrospirota bacterium]
MNIDFKDIEEGWYNARVSQIREGAGPHGPFLRIIFTITDGELQRYRFSGFVKPSGLKQGRLYRWITIILGEEPQNEFSTEELTGRECLVYLSRRKDRYTVIELCQKDMAPVITSPANKPNCLSV